MYTANTVEIIRSRVDKLSRLCKLLLTYKLTWLLTIDHVFDEHIFEVESTLFSCTRGPTNHNILWFRPDEVKSQSLHVKHQTPSPFCLLLLPRLFPCVIVYQCPCLHGYIVICHIVLESLFEKVIKLLLSFHRTILWWVSPSNWLLANATPHPTHPPTDRLCAVKLTCAACSASSVIFASSEDRRSLLAGAFAACLQVSSDGWVWRSAGCSCEAAGTFGFRLIQESELQSDSFRSCQIQDEIMVGHKVKIEPVWVNKAARRDWINFCRRHTGAQGCSPSFIYLIFFPLQHCEFRLD